MCPRLRVVDFAGEGLMGFVTAVWDFMWVAIFCFVGYWVVGSVEENQIHGLFYIGCVLGLFVVVAIKWRKGYYK